jgi:hypothetical protein
MALNHMNGIGKKNKADFEQTMNYKRVMAINEMNKTFATFFLTQLHNMMWTDYNKGVKSTIPFSEAYKLLKNASTALYDVLIASVDDKFNTDLAVSEMSKVAEIHNLNIDYALGKK